MKSLLLILILSFSLSLSGQSKKNQQFVISDIKASLVNDDHVSEGILVTVPGGCVQHYFRLDPGVNGGHIGNTSRIALRSSCDNGDTWSQPETVFDSPWDDRNVRGGITSDKNIIMFFRRYDATKYSTVHLDYLQSNDKGKSWSIPQTLEGIGLCDLCTYSDYFIELKENYYMLSQTVVGYTELSFFRIVRDKIVWEKEKTVLDYKGKKNIDEPRFIYLGNGKILGLFRDDQGTNYYQVTSQDFGKTWTVPEKTNICDGLFSPNPEIFYDKAHDLVFTIGTDRGVPYENDAVWVYANKPCDIFNNPLGYQLARKFTRPNPNSYQLYGYPACTRLKNGNYLIVFTETHLKQNGLEDGDFYQFSINFK